MTVGTLDAALSQHLGWLSFCLALGLLTCLGLARLSKARAGAACANAKPDKPQVSEPQASKSQVSQPQVSGLQVSESQVSESQVSQPQVFQPQRSRDRELSQLTAQNQALKEQLVCQDTLLEQLHQAEAATFQAEKMAMLGMLMAGVAHELNTPLGAIQASAENLNDSVIQLLRSLPQLCQQLDEEKLVALTQLLSWAEADPGNRSSREERQLKRAIKAKLQALDIADAPSLAETLSAMGVVQALDPVLPILCSPQVELFLGAAHSLSMIQRNGQNIGTAVSRADGTVSSLRNYARKGSQTQPSLIDLRSGIETVLMLYHNKLKHGIEVQAHYGGIPPLLCYPQELEQAWANIIGNAIQAMDGQGTLAIALTQTGENIEVQITDSGPGIPPETQSQIFTPYFTTKARGEGSGLGLAITQKIIRRHQGHIEVESSPGRTRFRISLPIKGLVGVEEGDRSLQDSPFHFSLYKPVASPSDCSPDCSSGSLSSDSGSSPSSAPANPSPSDPLLERSQARVA